jgi:hypothetical protein
MFVQLQPVLSAICIAGLAVWLVLTIANQFNFRWMQWVRGVDFMLLLPRWTFFAPNPGLSDFHLSYRTIAADGTPSPWEEIDLIAKRTLRSAVWNPDKRVTKAVIEAVAFLAPLSRTQPERVADSPPYRCLVNHAIRAAERSGRGHEFCEFRLFETVKSGIVRPDSFVHHSHPIKVAHAES